LYFTFNSDVLEADEGYFVEI